MYNCIGQLFVVRVSKEFFQPLYYPIFFIVLYGTYVYNIAINAGRPDIVHFSVNQQFVVVHKVLMIFAGGKCKVN